jgi:hypothetical protein
MERLGIADEMKSKTKLVDGVSVAEVVAKGEAEIGMQQINVILPVAGIHYVGPFAAGTPGLRRFFGRGVWQFRSSGRRRLRWSSLCPHRKLRHSLERVAWSRPHTELAIGR